MRIFITLLLLVSFGSFSLTLEQSKNIKKVSDFYGQRAGKRVNTWYNLIQHLRYKSKKTQMVAVNNFFNMLYYTTDRRIWGLNDYWATPLEFLGANAGDCEDYTIAKYDTLRQLGFKDNSLRLIYVKAIRLNVFHMVLAYYPTESSTPLLLDNLNRYITTADKRKDLYPIYSFNATKLWLMKKNGKLGAAKGSSSRLSSWKNLLRRKRNHSLRKTIVNFDE